MKLELNISHSPIKKGTGLNFVLPVPLGSIEILSNLNTIFSLCKQIQESLYNVNALFSLLKNNDCTTLNPFEKELLNIFDRVYFSNSAIKNIQLYRNEVENGLQYLACNDDIYRKTYKNVDLIKNPEKIFPVINLHKILIKYFIPAYVIKDLASNPYSYELNYNLFLQTYYIYVLFAQDNAKQEFIEKAKIKNVKEKLTEYKEKIGIKNTADIESKKYAWLKKEFNENLKSELIHKIKEQMSRYIQEMIKYSDTILDLPYAEIKNINKGKPAVELTALRYKEKPDIRIAIDERLLFLIKLTDSNEKYLKRFVEFQSTFFEYFDHNNGLDIKHLTILDDKGKKYKNINKNDFVDTYALHNWNISYTWLIKKKNYEIENALYQLENNNVFTNKIKSVLCSILEYIVEYLNSRLVHYCEINLYKPETIFKLLDLIYTNEVCMEKIDNSWYKDFAWHIFFMESKHEDWFCMNHYIWDKASFMRKMIAHYIKTFGIEKYIKIILKFYKPGLRINKMSKCQYYLKLWPHLFTEIKLDNDKILNLIWKIKQEKKT